MTILGLRPSVWKRAVWVIGNLGVTQDMSQSLARHTRICNYAGAAHFLITFPYFWVFRSFGATWLSFYVIPLSLFFASIPFINWAGFTTFSRLSLLAAINFSVYLYTASLGLGTSIHHVFFFTLISPLMLFHVREWKCILFSVAQPLGFFALLLWKGPWFIPPTHLNADAHAIISHAITGTTGAMLFTCSYVLIWSFHTAHEKLLQAKQLAEFHSQEKSRFLSTVSHEIRTPLNGIFGVLQSLGASDLPRHVQSDLRLMRSSGELLLAIINDTLDFSKIEAGRMDLDARPFHFRNMVEECLSLAEKPAKAKGLECTYRWETGIPEWVTGDEIRCRQICMNLLNNAVKFTEKGRISIQVSSIPTKEDFHEIRIAIQDTGIGIEANTLDRLFKPFSQADTGTSRKFGGTGLGLVISKRLAEAMGGNILVESVPGQGSVFTFKVKLQAAVPDSVHSILPAFEESTDFKGQRALLVEDNPVNQLVARRFLERIGFEVDIARHGGIALEKLVEQEYAVIFMDCQMPVMDGYETTKRIRAEEKDPSHQLIIALTANSQSEDMQHCLEAGMDDFIPKPIHMGQLVETLKKRMNMKA